MFFNQIFAIIHLPTVSTFELGGDGGFLARGGGGVFPRGGGVMAKRGGSWWDMETRLSGYMRKIKNLCM